MAEHAAPKVGLLPTPPIPEGLPKIRFANDNAKLVFYKRYVRKGLDGKPIETPEETFWRVAYHVAKAEKEFGASEEEVIERAKDFYRLLAETLFYPNSPTWTGAGTPLGQLAACFTEDMRVVTSRGLKRIADVQVGDLVLTHKGRFRPVVETMQRYYNGPLYRIKVKGIGVVLEVTPEHPILTPEGWVEVQHLKVGDWVAVGVPQGTQSAPVFDLALLEYAPDLEVEVTEMKIRARKPARYQHSGRLSRWNHRFIQLTPELARLCGYYVAEGTIGTDERYVRFTLGADEQEIQQDIAELVHSIFGIKPIITPSSYGKWVQVDVYSRVVAAWFRTHFGKGATQKFLPTWLLYAEPHIQKAFLIGLFRGDGLFTERIYPVQQGKRTKVFRSLRLTLANPSLIQQVWQILLRLGYDASIRPVDTKYVTPNASDAAQISLPPLSSRDFVQETFHITLPEPDPRYVRKHILRKENQVFFKVERIEVVPYSGLVYNMEVEEDHTYVTEGIVVHNCFVLPISDDMGRKDSGIFMTLRNAALIQQTGGGNGFAFSRLRPKGTVVKSSAGKATGPVGFLRVYDHAFGEIAQGGTRRGANMAVLRVDHPDVEEFITCKTDENAITNFNISVGITDAFMRAVEKDEEWELVFPDVTAPEYDDFDGTLEDAREQGIPIKVYKKVRARDLFEKIARQAHHNGEPGVLFLDRANRDNPVPHQYRLEATNPCGEQWLGPYENCCLGSINLAKHATPEGGVDWEKLADTVRRAVRFLDDVVQANQYVPAVPQLKEAAHRNRRIGLGIMGLADLMYINGIRYGSKEAQEFAAQIMEFIRFHAMKTSIELARERGPFPGIKGSIYDPENLKWKPPTWPDWLGGGPKTDWGRPELDWNEIVEGIKKYGIRNAAQLTIAPTGCLVAGSMVVTDQGVLPIEALGNPRATQWQDVRFRVASEGGVREATKFYVNGVAHTIKVRTRRGYVIQATDGHRIRVWERDRLVWKRMDEIRPGMKVVLTATGLIGQPRRVPLDNRLATTFHPVPVHLPAEMTPELAYLVGLFMGDGSLKDRTLRFSLSKPDLIEHTVRLIEQVFQATPKVVRDPRARGLVSIELHSRNVVEFWKRNGLAKRVPSKDHTGKGYEPHIPLAILQTNDPAVYAAFLAGLLDADGTVHGGYHLTWLTTHEHFHNQVKALLLALGVLTTTDFQTTGMSRARAFRLRTAHADAARRLWELLEPYTYRQHPAITVRRPSLRDTVPITQEEYAQVHALVAAEERYRVEAWRAQGFRASRASLRHIVETYRTDMLNRGLERLVDVIDGDVFFDEVVDVEDGGWQETFDLSVPGTHAYVAQGFISHNTISTVSGVEGYGCEPVFALAYYRYVNDEDGKRIRLRYVSPLFMKALNETDLSEEEKEAVIQHVLEYGTIQNYPGRLPEHIRHTFVVAGDISAEEHVYMQAALQVFIDNSISKTINFPADATVDDVKKAYMLAWKLGCKGLTVYVTGSREKVVLETAATAKKKADGGQQTADSGPQLADSGQRTAVSGQQTADSGQQIADGGQPTADRSLPTADSRQRPPDQLRLWPEPKKPRPAVLPGVTIQVETPLGRAYVTIHENGDGQPFEVFINTSKAGSETAAISEAIGRLISYILRLTSPVEPLERLREVLRQLQGLGGDRPLGFGPHRIRSLPDGVARALKVYLQRKETEEPGGKHAEALQNPPSPTLPLRLSMEPDPAAQAASDGPGQDALSRTGELCPECGQAALINEEGCRKCYACGYSEC